MIVIHRIVHLINFLQWGINVIINYMKNRAMLGQHHTEDTKHRMSLAHLGKKHSPEVLKKIGRKGRKYSIESRLKMSMAAKGKPKNYSLEQLKKRSEQRKGKNGTNWKGGITPINRIIRESLEYRLWRKAVFERDKYTCIWCGDNHG